jgi:transcriptional regulator with XRE-family HTH domain
VYYELRRKNMNIKLKTLILGKFYTQADFAKIIGISEAILSRIIRKRREASPQLKREISHKLGAPENEIFPKD